MLSSFSLFCRAATLGRGTVPILPDDVRRVIWFHMFPTPVVWCSACGVEVIVQLHDGTRIPMNTHSVMWLETPRCRWCTGYPHAHAIDEISA